MVSLETLSPEHQAEVVGALAFFSVTQSWKPKNYARSKKLKTTSPTLGGALNSSLTETEFKKISLQGAALGRANNQVRTWSCMPANHLTPMAFRRELDRFARSYRLKTTFINRKGLERLGAGAFLAVLRADPKSEGGLLKLSYRPRKSSSQKAIALVGKGLCYDTGGYNIKTGGHMFGMHQDMTGAALVAAFLGYLREVDYPAPVDAYIALAQNLVSESGYTPNEVVQAMDGTTIEVVDTDAEGRMVLSDTLAYVRKQKPRFVVDFATLTGSAIRSIGTTRSAVFSNQSETGLRAFQAGENSGERVWLFPLGEEYERSLESEVADILQCSHEAGSDHIYAATFLSRFVGKEIPWVHMDLSANSRKGGLGLIGSETTGFGILWVKSFLELMAKK
jgi:leucyl aminopeptidase